MRLISALTCAALLMFGVAPADALSSLEEWWPLGLRRERWRGRCPRTCECWEPHSQFLPGMEDLESSDDDGYPVYNCGKVDVKTKDNHYVAITCKDVSDICDELPFIQLFSNDTIGRLLLYDCPVPETFSCLLAKLGAADADTVKIFAPRGELRVNNIEGLKKTTELHYTAANQSSVQYDVLRALPSLEYFRIKDAKLHLPADELSESDETGDSSAHPSLKRFELISNQIQEVPHGAFRRFKGLTRLYLADNPIRNIYNESFIGE
ncbi:hypothetical protein evm_014475 [Chilo suppressalis]|nr:hypothetical protein evm_014475 [Chilo suppressalis]